MLEYATNPKSAGRFLTISTAILRTSAFISVEVENILSPSGLSQFSWLYRSSSKA